MDVLDAIRERRTVKQFRSEPVPRALIEQVLEAAVWAPNHRLTEPWAFVVVQGETLTRLAALRRRMTVEYLESRSDKALSPQQIARDGDDAARKALAAPVSIVVHLAQHADPVIREEDHLATSAAIQNMLLAAHALGLAAFWSTNNLLRYPPAFELLGIPPERRIAGIVQLGYAAQQREQRRTPAAALTAWLD